MWWICHYWFLFSSVFPVTPTHAIDVLPLAHWAYFIFSLSPVILPLFPLSCILLHPHSISLLLSLPCPPLLTFLSSLPLSLLLHFGCHNGVLWSSAGLPLHSGSVGGLPVCVCPVLLSGRLSWPSVCFGSFHRAWDWLLSTAWRLHQPHLSAAPPSRTQWTRTAAQGLYTALSTAG